MLSRKLSRLQTYSKMCLPIVRAIQNGIQKRFAGMVEDPKLIAAAILLPKGRNLCLKADGSAELISTHQKTFSQTQHRPACLIRL